MKKLSNISISEFRRALTYLSLTKDRTKGGHEAWKKEGLLRPVIFQTHVDPIPEFVIMNGLRNLNISKKEFLEVLDKI